MERIPALDGMRVVAIAMVAAYHVDNDVVPAGFWGVMLFFVLSGYLMTRVLCDEVDRTGALDRRSFYARRGVRLYSAVGAVCLALLLAGEVAWSSVAATLGLYANYARIEGLSLGLLTHTWFLAVIGHFCLLWPLVITTVPAKRRRQVVGLLALAAIVWRVVAIVALSPGWVYNATDTNAAAFLAGCYLAVARPEPSRAAGWSIPALTGLIFLPFFGEEGRALFWGGFVAIALSVAAIQYARTRPRWLEHRAMVWLGAISYGIYLWHYVYLRGGVALWAVAPLTIATAAASRYLLEKPLLAWVARARRRRSHSSSPRTVLTTPAVSQATEGPSPTRSANAGVTGPGAHNRPPSVAAGGRARAAGGRRARPARAGLGAEATHRRPRRHPVGVGTARLHPGHGHPRGSAGTTGG